MKQLFICLVLCVSFANCDYDYTESYPTISGENPNYYEDHGVTQQGQQRCYFNRAEIYLETTWFMIENCTIQNKLCYFDPDYYSYTGSTQGKAWCK